MGEEQARGTMAVAVGEEACRVAATGLASVAPEAEATDEAVGSARRPAWLAVVAARVRAAAATAAGVSRARAAVARAAAATRAETHCRRHPPAVRDTP